MKVILLQNIKGLGNKFDVKQVKDGYGHNFLLPKKLVKIATAKTIKELEAQKAAWQKQEEETKNKLEVLTKELSEKEFQFTLKTGEKGEVFGSITKDDIQKAILALISNFQFLISNNVEVNLERPIKTLGPHQVGINLGKGVKAEIKINVIAL